MYKQSSGKGRYSGASNSSRYSSGNRGSQRRSGYRGGGGGRRFSGSKIAHSNYISDVVRVEELPTYTPQHKFAELNLHSILIKNIQAVGYISPTKIQDQAIPHILQGKDVIGVSNTGSGKTAAFLIPMIDKVLRNPETKVLIVTPTRELAQQINIEIRKFSKDSNIRTVVVIGGANIREQTRLLRNSPQFVVATPGRLMDLEKRNYIHLNNFSCVVLDEVDRMLDMGFVNDIKLIIAKLAVIKQSLFFSATLSYKEESLANSLLKDPIKVEADKHNPLKNIRQNIVKVGSKDQKLNVLQDLLRKEEFSKVLVFSSTKHMADTITKQLRLTGVRVDALHGNKSQHIRSKVIERFRTSEIDVLIATDVAARGIDIKDITHVINFDEPANLSDYVHRIGRTGRIGKVGHALTFVLG